MRKMPVFKHFLLVTLSVLVVACGGGGGGGAGGAGPSGEAGTNTGGLVSTPSTPIASGVYILSWDTVADPAVLGYRVYYATSPFSRGKILGQLDTGATSLEFHPGAYGVTAGSAIYMAVSSLGANGLESPISNQVSIVVQ